MTERQEPYNETNEILLGGTIKGKIPLVFCPCCKSMVNELGSLHEHTCCLCHTNTCKTCTPTGQLKTITICSPFFRRKHNFHTHSCFGCDKPICERCFETELDNFVEMFAQSHKENNIVGLCEYFPLPEDHKKFHPNKCLSIIRSKKERKPHITRMMVKSFFFCDTCKMDGTSDKFN